MIRQEQNNVDRLGLIVGRATRTAEAEISDQHFNSASSSSFEVSSCKCKFELDFLSFALPFHNT